MDSSAPTNASSEEKYAKADSTIIKNPVMEMQINKFRKKFEAYGHDESISTPKLAIFGITDCYLQFYPKGSFWCTKEGHFSVLFGCPSWVQIDILMYAGNISERPQVLLENEETKETVYGLHDFGKIEDLTPGEDSEDPSEDLAIGVEFLSIKFLDATQKESEKIVRLTMD